MWEPQLAIAGGGWRVIAPDFAIDVAGGARLQPDNGGPEAPIRLKPDPTQIGGNVTMGDYAARVIDLLDALHIEDAVVGGCSMGGSLAFALYRRAPRYFRGLLLVDTRAEADAPEALERREKMLQLVAGTGTAAVVDEMVPKLLGGTTRRTRPDVVERARSIALANGVESIAGMIRALMSRQDSTPLLPSIRIPTLIIVGEEDTLTPPEVSERMHKAISGSQLAVLPAAGHLSSLEDPQTFNDTLARFLDHRL